MARDVKDPSVVHADAPAGDAATQPCRKVQAKPKPGPCDQKNPKKSKTPCVHTVQPGQNLSTIVAGYGVPLKKAEKDNPQLAADFNKIYPCDEVLIKK